MKRVLREQAKVYCFDRSLPPQLRVSPDEKFVVETEDASSGYLREEGQSPLNRPFIDETWPPSANPVAGPIYIQGVRRGDLLAIKIEDILVAADQSYTFSARRGPIQDSLKWSQAAEPYTHVMVHKPGPSGTMRDGRVCYNSRVPGRLPHSSERSRWPLKGKSSLVSSGRESAAGTSTVGISGPEILSS